MEKYPYPFPDPNPYPHTTAHGTKRAYNDENSFDSNDETTTLIGNNCAAAESHRRTISAQHDQQRRRTSQTFPIGSPLDPIFSPEEDYYLQGSLQSPNQGFLHCSTPRHLAGNTGDTGRYTQSQNLPLSFNDLNQAQPHSFTIQSPSGTFGRMSSSGRQDRRRPRLVVEELVDSGSEDSRTLRSSQTLSRTTSLGGPHDLTFNTANNISQSTVSESSYSLTMMEDPENGTHEGLAILSTQDQYAPYSEIWQNQDIEPWTTFGASYPQHPQQYVSNHQLPLNSIDEGFLYGDPHLETMNMSSVDPSQVSFECFNASQSSNEMPVEAYSDTIQDHESAPSVGLDFAYSGNQDQEEVGSRGTVLDNYGRQSSYFEVPESISATTKSFQSVTGGLITSDLFTPLVRQPSVETSHTMSHGSLTVQSSSSKERNRSMPLRESALPKAAAKKCEWVNSVFRNGALLTIENQTPLNRSAEMRKGIRTHPLSVESKKKAAETRRTKSTCLRCWVEHISCDKKKVCDNCSRLPLPFTSRICLKPPLSQRADYLFPELVVARHDRAVTAKIFKDNIKGFKDNDIQIEISSGPDYPPIKLTATEFTTRNRDFLLLYHSPPNPSSPSSTLLRVYGPPIGLRKNNKKLQIECVTHMKEMIKHDRFSGDAANGNAAPVSRKILEAINYYRSSADNGSIENAMQLLATHHFMRKIPSFTQDSVQKIYDSLTQPWQLPYERRPSSKLLNHQIKREVHELQQEWTKNILEELERVMRKKTLSLWTTCFSVLTIMCMCIEAVQLSIDGFIVHCLVTDDPDGGSQTREDGLHKSRTLEDLVFTDLLDYFHVIYRLKKFKDFHPIRDGANANFSKDLDQSSVQFINEIHKIVRENRDHLEEKAKNPIWGVEENLLLDHYRFRRENSGRLVAKFLLSFL